MLEFPNVDSEPSFIRAYKYETAHLMREIRRYVEVHGFDKRNYDAMFSSRLGDLYISLSEALATGRLSQSVMGALSMLYHKEVRELGRDFGFPFDDYTLVLTEYNKVKHVIEV